MLTQGMHRIWICSILFALTNSFDLDTPGLKGSASIRRRTQESSSTSVTAEVYIKFDDFPPETGWSIVNAETKEAVVDYPVGTYPLGQPDLSETVTLVGGQSYVFTVIDGFGDGMSNPITGFFSLKQGGLILVEADGDFEESQSIPFTTTIETEPPVSSPAPVTVPIPTTPATFSPTISIRVNVTVEIIFDSFPSENGWSITSTATNETIVDVPIGTYEFGQDNVTQLVELSTGQEYVVTIVDQFGDGTCCIEPGGFTIRQDEIILVDRFGTTIGQSLEVRFTPFFPESDSTSPSLSPTTFPSTTPSPTVRRSPNPTTSPVEPPSASPVIAAQTEIPTDTGSNVEVTVRIVFDAFPQETGWSIVAMNGTIIVSFPIGTYTIPQTEVFESVVLLADTTYNFTLIDFFSDGMVGGRWEILQENVTLVSGNGDEFSSSVTIPFTARALPDTPTGETTDGLVGSTTAPTGSASIVATSRSPTPAPFPAAIIPPTIVDADGLVEVAFELIFDRFPEETSWSLNTAMGEEIESSPADGYSTSSGDVNQSYRLEAGGSYVFVIRDRFDDGLCCSDGKFSFSQQGVVLVSGGGNFGTEASFPFTILDEESPSDAQTASPVATQSPTAAPTAFPTILPTASMNGTMTPTSMTDLVNVTILILFDDFAEEIGWSITLNSTDEEIISVPIGAYPLLTETAAEVVTLVPEELYQFTIEDFFGDGLTARGRAEVGSYLILQDVVVGDTITLVVGEPGFGFNETVLFSPVLV